jgi:hypothetical protein
MIDRAASVDPLEARKRLTFEQAEGAEPVPSQLKLKELSPRLRALLWEVIFRSLERSRIRNGRHDELLPPWEDIFYAMHVDREHRMADDFTNDFHVLLGATKTIFMGGDYVQVFGWIQHVLRSSR